MAKYKFEMLMRLNLTKEYILNVCSV